MVRDISPEEVKLHSSEKDCWIIVHNKVYDVTKYLNDHPGGVEIVTDLAGMDASADYDDVGHTQEAHEILEKFCIGNLKAGASFSGGSAPPQQAPKETPKEAPKQTYQEPPRKVESSNPPSNNASRPVQNKPPQVEEDNSVVIMAGAAIAALTAGFMLYRRMAKA